jgi:glyoxylase-like metal-dependent hydrolase (beta-lactamase superfamily II)
MTIHFLNCFTCNARVPSSWHTGLLCLLVETDQGLALIDTGPGLQDYIHRPGILTLFKIITIVPLDPEETAIRQITRLGYKPEDVRNIVLTHMHFDHCGGLNDFPWAAVHIYQGEYEAFIGRPRHWTDLAYVPRHLSQDANVIKYRDQGENWLGLPAIRLPFQPEMWLVPLFGHTRGHCGVAIRSGDGWLFHVADAGPVALQDYAPRWLISLVLGPHFDNLRTFAAAHPQVRITTGHMWLDFFAANKSVSS